MSKYIIVGCDVHEKTIVAKIALDREESTKRVFANTEHGRRKMVELLQERVAADGTGPHPPRPLPPQGKGSAVLPPAPVAGERTRVVVAYEASSLGFGLYDYFTEAGFDCYVLAPSCIERSRKEERNKDDDRDAQRVFEILRGHFLAGNKLPAIWIPDKKTRDDRELVRAILDVTEKMTAVKTQIQTLLKRNSVRRPPESGKSWTCRFCAWLEELKSEKSPLAVGARNALGTLLRQLEALEKETLLLRAELDRLTETDRYKESYRELTGQSGIGLLTAMIFLVEMGDLSRFKNRRQVAAFLGLSPTSYESGEKDDCKGHITHQGPGRVRKALCQAAWSRIRTDDKEKAAYGRIAARNRKHKKIAVVAIMRRLAIRMWHLGLTAQQRSGAYARPNAG